VETNADGLGTVGYVRLEPRENRASDAEAGAKATDEDVMINGVKGCTKV